MKYNSKYNRWVSKNGIVYRYDEHKDKLVACAENEHHGYAWCSSNTVAGRWAAPIHKLVWETFNGKIPEGLEIDHMDNNRKNNNIDNLQLVTRGENNRLRFVRGYIAEGNKKKYLSEFGKLFYEKYGFSETENRNLYSSEYKYWRKHGCLKI